MSVVCPPSDDADFLWRLARAARDLALEPSVDAEQKKQLTYEAFENAKKALEKDDKSFAVHKVTQRFTTGSVLSCLSQKSVRMFVLFWALMMQNKHNCHNVKQSF